MTRRREIPVSDPWTASPPSGFDPAGLGRVHAWSLLLGARRLTVAMPIVTGFRLGADGTVRQGADGGSPVLLAGEGNGWRPGPALRDASPDVRDFLSLYLPALAPVTDRGFTLAHLGQSIDGCIAAAGGHALHVTGEENLAHLHRLRALCDAVVLGAGSVASDDPRLTVRLVEGESPVRVLLDPRRRLASPRHVFDDGEAPTLVASPDVGVDARAPIGRAMCLRVPAGPDGRLDLAALLEALARRGLRRTFVEGGGVTVTRFVDAGLVDRLHVAIAPVLVGRGVPGLQLAPASTMADARRPPARLHRMGDDVLWDLDLATARHAGPSGGSASTS